MHPDPIRLVIVAACLSFVGCGKDGNNKNDESGAGDTGDTGPGIHPWVPEGYEYLWDTDGCEQEDGTTKTAVYHLASGRSEDGESITITEQYYWFFGQPEWEGDCIDEFVFDAQETNVNWGASEPCYGCEKEYSGDYVENEDTEHSCGNITYGKIFLDDHVKENVFEDTTLMFDTHTIAGDVNERMLVISAFRDDNYYYPDSNYGTGSVTPDVEGDYDGAVSYEWTGTAVMCIGW